jgi:hypothetical protein
MAASVQYVFVERMCTFVCLCFVLYVTCSNVRVFACVPMNMCVITAEVTLMRCR